MSLEQGLMEYGAVSISFQLDAKSNQLISASAKRSGRTKKQEAIIRLRDHLIKYQSISEVNVAQKRNSTP